MCIRSSLNNMNARALSLWRAICRRSGPLSLTCHMAWRRRRSSAAGSWWRTQSAGPAGKAAGTWRCRWSGPVCAARPPGGPLRRRPFQWWVLEGRPRSPSRYWRHLGTKGLASWTGPLAPGRSPGSRWSSGVFVSTWRPVGSPKVGYRKPNKQTNYTTDWQLNYLHSASSVWFKADGKKKQLPSRNVFFIIIILRKYIYPVKTRAFRKIIMILAK